MTQGTPIHVLTQRDGRKNRIIAPFGLVFERGNRNVKNRKHQIVSTKLYFTSEKSSEFKFAIFAVDRPWRNDGNEKDGLIDRGVDFRFPQLAWSDCCLILPQAEGCLGAAELGTQLAVNAVS
jgi:hypothetical protein